MHTQGPWKYDINPTAPEAIIVDWEGYTVVELSAIENTTCASDLEANARLIAAAPDMLDALQRAREVLLWNLGDDARIDAAFDAVTAAINRATYTKEQTA
jgi:hypothetical protein